MAIVDEPSRPLRINELDLSRRLTRQEYKVRAKCLLLELVQLQRKVGESGMRVIILFEGLDAAGKGGAIKRLTAFLDPRGVRVHALGPASQLDAAQHYLRRFWMRLPKPGRISIFDDYSWYGRMLLEHIEGLISEEKFQRSAREICEFERTLVAEGYCLIKFWLHVSREQQLQRFERRLANPYKSWKMTPEDWRNQELYDQYTAHADAMFAATDAPHAPWHLIPADNKLLARVSVLETVVEILRRWPELSHPLEPFASQPGLFELIEDEHDPD
jgi:polyphosphate kinase 2 (PPK2 family)